MGACNFDWELASKFVPVVAIFITIVMVFVVYYLWHRQKGKEVIASEAKDILINLGRLQTLQTQILKSTTDLDNTNFDKKSFEEFKTVQKTLEVSSIFLNSILDDKKQLSKLLKSVVQQSDSFIKNINSWWNEGTNLDDKKQIQDIDALSLKKKLKKHALYKQKAE